MLSKLKPQCVTYIYLSLLKGALSLFNLIRLYAETDSVFSLLRELVSCKSKSVYFISSLTSDVDCCLLASRSPCLLIKQ